MKRHNRARMLAGITLAAVGCATSSGLLGACGGDDNGTGDASNDVTNDTSTQPDVTPRDATTNDVSNDVSVNDAGDATVSDASDATVGDANNDGTTTLDASDAAPGDATSDALSSDGGCDAVTSPWHYVVDPKDGSDSAGSTGSGTSGGNASSACAFKTITHAIAQILAANPTPVSGTQILVKNTGVVSSGEIFPIAVPQNVLIQGSGGMTVVQPGSTKTAFSFAKTNSALDNLQLDGQSQSASSAINALAGSDTTDKVTNLVIKDFANDAVFVSDGGLTIADGVEISGTGTGAAKFSAIHVTGAGKLTIQPASAQVHIHDNSLYGVQIDTTAAAKIIGSLGATPPSTATVLIEKNTSGIFIQQTPAAGPLNDIESIASVNNTSNGLELYGGSTVKVRTSYILSNALVGISVATSPIAAGGGSDSDVSQIDLGKAADYGKNRVQDATKSNGNAGICLNLSSAIGQNLYAAGNIFSAAIDCSTTNADGGAFILTKGKCQTGAQDTVGIAGSQNNSVTVTQCTLQ